MICFVEREVIWINMWQDIFKERGECMPREILVNEVLDDMIDLVKIIKLNTYINIKKQVKYLFFI